MGDVHILNGLGDILNDENIKPGVDLKELERKMISGGLIQKTRDPLDKFNDELRETARKLGINFDEFSGKKRRDPSPPPPPPPPQEDSDEPSDDESASDDDDEPVTTSMSQAIAPDPPTPPPERQRFGAGYRPLESIQDSTLREKTLEQEKRSHINMVNRELGVQNIGFSFEKEKEEDIKLLMLDEISSLMTSLQEEDVDLSRIPLVDAKSSFEEVESVLKILRLKNDRSRYCSLAEELAIFGAYSLEDLFNGKNMWFGRYKPDLTGWHNQVNCKLRRMRHDTSQLMGSIIQDNNISPLFRILFELVPNMILYSRMRKQQYGQESIYNDPKFARPTESELSRMNDRIRDIGSRE